MSLLQTENLQLKAQRSFTKHKFHHISSIWAQSVLNFEQRRFILNTVISSWRFLGCQQWQSIPLKWKTPEGIFPHCISLFTPPCCLLDAFSHTLEGQHRRVVVPTSGEGASLAHMPGHGIRLGTCTHCSATDGLSIWFPPVITAVLTVANCIVNKINVWMFFMCGLWEHRVQPPRKEKE